ncbi:MAG TPA: DUF2975 domain-containing protein [Candidatus Acidoferrum sp.]|nr:DUF2975 domain-containing protein [Candidatus Acidoferrum sp.]
MPNLDHVSDSSVKTKSDDLPKRLLAPIGRMLSTDDSAATVNRLFISQHVPDLRLIIAFSLVAVILVFGFGVVLSIVNVSVANPSWGALHVGFSALGSFLTFFTPVLGVFGAVLAWAYQKGSARLGIVDLFACEIDTLCRVATVVDAVRRQIETFQHGQPPQDAPGHLKSPARHFTSEENYFPVFENNTRDLQDLEARVVINITAFYTYMKAVRDSVRALMDMPPLPAEPQPRPDNPSTSTPWQDAARNVVYMLFLGLESARKAMHDLVEFQPERAERKIVILLSELEAYRFLRDQFVDEHDIRYLRLALRDDAYKDVVPKLCQEVEDGIKKEEKEAREKKAKAKDGKPSEPARPSDGSHKTSQWEPADKLVPELKRRYEAATTRSSQPRRSAATA